MYFSVLQKQLFDYHLLDYLLTKQATKKTFFLHVKAPFLIVNNAPCICLILFITFFSTNYIYHFWI